MLLAQQADFGVFCGLCEEVEALRGMRERKQRLREYWAYVAVLKLCVFDLLLASSRLLLLANAPNHPEIRLLRQQHRCSGFAPAILLPCPRAHNATL